MSTLARAYPMLQPFGWRHAARILSVERAHLIGYWPLWESAGSIAYDISGNNRHGTHVGVTLGQPGIGDGRTSPLYDGTSDYTNVYSAALAAAFNGAEGTLLIWAKVANAGVWTDGAYRRPLRFSNNAATSDILIYKDAANNILLMIRKGGGVSNTRSLSISLTTWFCLAMTWSEAAGQVASYLNGVLQGAILTGLGTWSGALTNTTAVIGASTPTPTQPWSGNLAHCALWSKALTAAQVAYLSKV